MNRVLVGVGVNSLNTFYQQVNCLVNMESRQENHNKRVFECFYQASLSMSDSYIPVAFSEKRQTARIKFWVAIS